MQDQTTTQEQCAGYQREPHVAQIVIYREFPDGTREGLCQVCATRWQLSDEEWPPKKSENETEDNPVRLPTPPLTDNKKVI
jgi:hypothetical protein